MGFDSLRCRRPARPHYRSSGTLAAELISDVEVSTPAYPKCRLFRHRDSCQASIVLPPERPLLGDIKIPSCLLTTPVTAGDAEADGRSASTIVVPHRNKCSTQTLVALFWLHHIEKLLGPKSVLP